MYTDFATGVTLLHDEEQRMKFNKHIAGHWSTDDDGRLLLRFRGTRLKDFVPYLHIFVPVDYGQSDPTTYQLLEATNEAYKAYPTEITHKNTTQYVLMMRINHNVDFSAYLKKKILIQRRRMKQTQRRLMNQQQRREQAPLHICVGWTPA